MIQGIGFLGFDSWVCIHWFLGLNIISILGKLKISFLSLPYLQSICINNRKWVQIPGFGFLGLDSCVWIPAFGFLGLDSWVWIPGFGVLGLDSWAWIPGLGVLRLGSRAWIPGFRLLARTLVKTLSKPMRFEPNLLSLWSPPRSIAVGWGKAARKPISFYKPFISWRAHSATHYRGEVNWRRLEEIL